MICRCYIRSYARRHAILVASPVYWFTISAQTKLCIDRWYALQGSQGNELAHKKFGLILTYGDTDPYTSGAINAIRTFQDMIRYIDADSVGIVYGSVIGRRGCAKTARIDGRGL